MFKVPPRSAGICQRYDDFDLLDDLIYQARTTGLKGNELNFVLLKQGILQDGSELHHGLDRTHEFNPNNLRRGPDLPHIQQKLRDDLELKFASKYRLRPY